MIRDYNLNALLDFARTQGVSVAINYHESCDELEITVNSAAVAECFYMKRVPNIDYFVQKWREHVKYQIETT